MFVARRAGITQAASATPARHNLKRTASRADCALTDVNDILPMLAGDRSHHAGSIEGLANRLETATSVFTKTLPQLNRSWPRVVSCAFAFFCVILGFAASGNAASTGPQPWPVSSRLATSQFAIADFDGDNQPDLATVQIGHSDSWDTQYWIAFQLSSGARQTLGITAPTGGLRITSRDVNGDDFLDIVVTTAWTNRPVAVLLNDGQGNFRVLDPSTFSAAFTTSEKSCAAPADDTKDAAAAFLSRNRADICQGAFGVFSSLSVTGPLFTRTSRHSLSLTLVSFLGRAPPSFVLHL